MVDEMRVLAARFAGEPYAATAMAAVLIPIDRAKAREWLLRPEVRRATDALDLAQAARGLLGVEEYELAEAFVVRARAATRGPLASVVEDSVIGTEGWIASSRGDLQGAEHKLRLVMQRNPNVAFAASDIVWFLDNLGRVEEALALLESGGSVDDPEELHRIRERTLDRHPKFRGSNGTGA